MQDLLGALADQYLEVGRGQGTPALIVWNAPDSKFDEPNRPPRLPARLARLPAPSERTTTTDLMDRPPRLARLPAPSERTDNDTTRHCHHLQVYPDARAYHAKYSSLSPPQAKATLAALHAQVPWDLVRRFLLSIAPGPVSRSAEAKEPERKGREMGHAHTNACIHIHTQEAFLTARSTFASSLAAFSVCSYIAGVGDRHTENFLVRGCVEEGGLACVVAPCTHTCDHHRWPAPPPAVNPSFPSSPNTQHTTPPTPNNLVKQVSQRSGAVIGIDFGFAFGMGASALPVPELIPFRLTRQLVK